MPTAEVREAMAQMASAAAVMSKMQVPKLLTSGTFRTFSTLADKAIYSAAFDVTELAELSSALAGFQDDIAQIAGDAASLSNVEVPRLVGMTPPMVFEALEAADISRITGASHEAVLAALSSLAPLQKVASQAAGLADAVAQMGVPDILSEEARAAFIKAAGEFDTSTLATALDEVVLSREQFSAANTFDTPTNHSITAASDLLQELIKDADKGLSDTEAYEDQSPAPEPDGSEHEHDQVVVAKAVLLIVCALVVATAAYKFLEEIALVCDQLLKATMFAGSLTSALYGWLSEILPDDNVIGWVANLAALLRSRREEGGGRE